MAEEEDEVIIILDDDDSDKESSYEHGGLNDNQSSNTNINGNQMNSNDKLTFERKTPPSLQSSSMATGALASIMVDRQVSNLERNAFNRPSGFIPLFGSSPSSRSISPFPPANAVQQQFTPNAAPLQFFNHSNHSAPSSVSSLFPDQSLHNYQSLNKRTSTKEGENGISFEEWQEQKRPKILTSIHQKNGNTFIPMPSGVHYSGGSGNSGGMDSLKQGPSDIGLQRSSSWSSGATSSQPTVPLTMNPLFGISDDLFFGLWLSVCIIKDPTPELMVGTALYCSPETSIPNLLNVRTVSRGKVIGFVEPNSGAILRSLIDKYYLKIEGSVQRIFPANPETKRDMCAQILLNIYGKFSVYQEVVSCLSSHSNFFRNHNEFKAQIQRAFMSSRMNQASSSRSVLDDQRTFNRQPLVVGEVKLRGEDEIQSRLQQLMKDSKLLKLPSREPVSGLLKTNLYEHQKQALYWMMLKENPDVDQVASNNHVPSLYEVKEDRLSRKVYTNVVLQKSSFEKPDLILGGVLGDDMGLGKTLTMISLFAETISLAKLEIEDSKDDSSSDIEYVVKDLPTAMPKVTGLSLRKIMSHPICQFEKRKSSSTLIVAPVSLLGHWKSQIEVHCIPDKISCLIYHGGSRGNNAFSDILKHDVIITTYQIVANELSRAIQETKATFKVYEKLCPLHLIDWYRIVLDEAHIIKQHKTLQAKAAYLLSGRRRWCLTGTPIQNNLLDMYSLIKFMHLKPFSEKDFWTRLFGAEKKIHNSARLQMLLKCLVLRRTKNDEINGKRLVDLPPKVEKLVSIQLDDVESYLYEKAFDLARDVFSRLDSSKPETRSYLIILESILRLRQICTHFGLCLGWLYKTLKDDDGFLNVIKRLEVDESMLLISNNNSDCLNCLGPVGEQVIFECQHLFCKECISNNGFDSCPICASIPGNLNGSNVAMSSKDDPQSLLSQQSDMDSSLVDLETGDSATPDTMDTSTATNSNENLKTTSKALDNLSSRPSSKVRALIEDLMKDENRNGKSVVFSQWTTLLDLIAGPLTEYSIKYVKFDGSMNRQRREEAVEKFQKDPSISVFLISLKAGGVGLNLTAASRVYLMDPWWNPSVELQAVDRVHRLGQTKPVQTIRFVARGSIEERILALQSKKAKITSVALMEDVNGQSSSMNIKLKLSELKSIFSSGKAFHYENESDHEDNIQMKEDDDDILILD